MDRLKKIRLTGKKWDQKVYARHTGHPGGLRTRSAKQLMDAKPTDMIKIAVKGMLPKNKLQQVYLKNLHIVYTLRGDFRKPTRPNTTSNCEEGGRKDPNTKSVAAKIEVETPNLPNWFDMWLIRHRSYPTECQVLE